MTLNQYYNQLKSFQIVKYKMEEDNDFGYVLKFPTFILQRGQEQIKIVISKDEEGNDGGFLFIEDSQEVVKQKEKKDYMALAEVDLESFEDPRDYIELVASLYQRLDKLNALN